MATYYTNIVQKSEEEILQELIQEIWDKHDHDRNGLIDFDEMKEFINEFMFKLDLPVHSEYNYDNIFEKLDSNGDNSIDKSEMEKFIKNCMKKEVN